MYNTLINFRNDFYHTILIVMKRKEKEKNDNTKFLPKLKLNHVLNRLNTIIILL